MSGAASNNRGKWTEQAVARWFRANGFEQCERTVRTGYRVAARSLADGGDLQLCPGAIASVKALRPVNRAERAVPGWLAETEAQRVAAGADVALLVVRRDGTADVGEWFAWLPLHEVISLAAFGFDSSVVRAGADVRVPVRLLVADACRLLRAGGYGEPEDTKIPELTPSPPLLITDTPPIALAGRERPGRVISARTPDHHPDGGSS